MHIYVRVNYVHVSVHRINAFILLFIVSLIISIYNDMKLIKENVS